MQTINMLFLKIVQMSLTAGVVILVVLFVRLFLRRLPRGFAYALWLVVAFRLVVPAAVGSKISIFHILPGGSVNGEIGKMSEITDGETIGADSIGGQVMQGYTQNVVENAKDAMSTTPDEDTIRPSLDRNVDNAGRFGRNAMNRFYSNVISVKMQDNSLTSVMALIWIAGILIFVSYTVIADIRIRRRIRYSVRLCGNVYECDAIRSPFVIGIVSPRIYLPFRLNETQQQCILAHERYHIKRKDYLIKDFAYLLVMVYWFHPLVWAAYRLMCIDMEMSCDEKVISQFTVELRKEYSRLLLAFAVNKRQFSVRPLAFGEENIMERIKNILNDKKTAQWKLIGGVVVLMFTMAACATDASMDEALVTEPADTVFGMKNDSENMTDTLGHVEDRADVIVHNYHIEDSVQNAVNHDSIEHHPAQWAENSKFDMEFYSLDYADTDRIVFHISSGLFVYDLKRKELTRSIDLKALNCQAVQTGGECKVTVYQYQDSGSQLRAVIRPYPYRNEDSYIYDLESDELFAYDVSLLEHSVLFDGFASKYDSTVSEALRTWRAAENVLPLGENSYGALYWGPGPDLTNMCYEAGDQKWQIFHKEQATLPKLLKQDDSFYQSFSLYSGREIGQCLLDYKAFYNMHDYAGVCALSTGLDYSDELWQEFHERTDILSEGSEVSHSEDEKEYLFAFMCSDESGGNAQKVYVNFKYLEGEGWRAEGLPTAEQ